MFGQPRRVRLRDIQATRRGIGAPRGRGARERESLNENCASIADYNRKFVKEKEESSWKKLAR